jgi:hypothetical protein
MTAKLCKYGCNKNLSWDTAANAFKEEDGTPHTKERCAYIKSLLPKPTATSSLAAAPTADFDKRQADIQKSHLENMEASKEMTHAILALASEIQGLKQVIEIIVKDSVIQKSFKTATLEVERQ